MAILVPELKKIIFGMESWWDEIDSVDEVSDITGSIIADIWYVKMLREMEEEQKC